ncbi:RidA family protein [Acidovorax sp. sic0104]|uniref:RidA family protein n=1 Tax=Acidovorax sp. sic0104 TaxID=2854784 RepID=UPI001C485D2F|nr:RidA family protein [Acidovorax sp. sic0104]MBV7542733.1 RidA family protein [Acidovorax sp. sic0104]
MPQIASFLTPHDAASLTRLVHLNPERLYDPAPNGYSHLVVAPLHGRTVYVSGQGGENAAGELPSGFAAQLDQALRNMEAALAAADATVHDVARLTLLVVDHTEERLALWTQAARGVWKDAPTPACTLIPVPRLALDGMLVEVEATAVVTGTAATPGTAAQIRRI